MCIITFAIMQIYQYRTACDSNDIVVIIIIDLNDFRSVGFASSLVFRTALAIRQTHLTVHILHQSLTLNNGP